MARGLGDLLEPTGTEGGDAMRSKKGDLVITIDPTRTRGKTLRIVVEAKDRSMPIGRMATELAEARANRSAAIALAVFTPSAPTSVSPLALVGADVYATYDPLTDDAVALEAAYRTARILALLTLRDAPMQLDAEAITRSLEDLTRQVDCVRGLKTKLTAHRLDRARGVRCTRPAARRRPPQRQGARGAACRRGGRHNEACRLIRSPRVACPHAPTGRRARRPDHRSGLQHLTASQRRTARRSYGGRLSLSVRGRTPHRPYGRRKRRLGHATPDRARGFGRHDRPP